MAAGKFAFQNQMPGSQSGTGDSADADLMAPCLLVTKYSIQSPLEWAQKSVLVAGLIFFLSFN